MSSIYTFFPAATEMGRQSEFALDSSGNQTWVHTNVSAGGVRATYINDGQGPHYSFTDWVGTTRVQTNYTGTVERTCQSLPFGDGPICTSVTEQFYTGYERDPETQNDYAQARHYASTMGRFLSPDPSGLAAANMSNPQSFNLYAYVKNNPLISVDPTGLSGCQLEGIDINCSGLNEGAVACPNNNCDAYFDFTSRQYKQFHPTEDDPYNTVALTDPLADPNAFDPATQGCLVDRINAQLGPEGVQVDVSPYTTQGGHAEFGLTQITDGSQLTNAGLTFYTSPFGNANGYRDSNFFNSLHVNGRGGHDLPNVNATLSNGNPNPNAATVDNPTRNAQAHFDAINSSKSAFLHGLVDYVVGKYLGGTALDPSCP